MDVKGFSGAVSALTLIFGLALLQPVHAQQDKEVSQPVPAAEIGRAHV